MRVFIFILLFLISTFFSESTIAATKDMMDHEQSILYAHTDQFQAVGYIRKSGIDHMDYLEKEFPEIMKKFDPEFQGELLHAMAGRNVRDFLISLGDKITYSEEPGMDYKTLCVNLDDQCNITVRLPLSYTGSAALINHASLNLPENFRNRVVLTCAHNLHFSHENCNSNNLTFHLKTSPNQRFSHQYEQRKIINIFYPTEYNSKGHADQKGDIAFVILEQPIPTNLTPLSLSNLSLNESLGKSITVVGFPRAGIFSSSLLVDDGMKRAGRQLVNTINANKATFYMIPGLFSSNPLQYNQLLIVNHNNPSKEVQNFDSEKFFSQKKKELTRHYSQPIIELHDSKVQLIRKNPDLEKITEKALQDASLLASTYIQQVQETLNDQVKNLLQSLISLTNNSSISESHLSFLPEIPPIEIKFPHEPQKTYTFIKRPYLPIISLNGNSGGPALVWDGEEQQWKILGVAFVGVSHIGTQIKFEESERLELKRSESSSFPEHIKRIAEEFKKNDQGKDIRTSINLSGYTYVGFYVDRFQKAFHDWLKSPEESAVMF